MATQTTTTNRQSRRAAAAQKGKQETPATTATTATTAPAAPRLAWNAGKTVLHHAVQVTGHPKKELNQTYASCWKAFQALGLPKAEDDYGPCVKFRKALKLAPKGEKELVIGEGKSAVKLMLKAIAKGASTPAPAPTPVAEVKKERKSRSKKQAATPQATA